MTEIKPADDKLIASLADAVTEVRTHDHRPQYGPDLYCLNLTSWMGERMGAALARVDEQNAEIQRLRAALDTMPAVVGEVDRQRGKVAAERRARERLVARITELTVSTDGDPLDHAEEIPVGEIVRVLAEGGAS